MIYRHAFLIVILISGSSFFSCDGEGNKSGSANAPEIVDRRSDTTFTNVPDGEHHGIETYAEADGAESLLRSMASTGSFSRFMEAVNQAEIGENIDGNRDLTIFAPTDEAFSKVPQEKIDELFKPENKQKLVEFVNNHIIRGNINHGDLTDGKELTNMNGNTIQIKMVDGQPSVHNSIITEQDSNPENGAVYALDEVIMPPGM